ncbi:hypothetical protein [Bacillus sp. REN3]|nr:hypothetical protein [Bacillus sp. REN3]
MPKKYFLTPEEAQRKRELKKKLIYVSFILLAVLLSAGVTILANQM